MILCHLLQFLLVFCRTTLYCLIIDLSNVAIANQYKNQFDQELNVDHVGVKGSLPKNFRSFDALEKSLKKKFKEYCEQMSVIKQEKQIWYQGGADISGEYDTKETESEKGNFIYQCRSCTKLRKIPRVEITASSNKTLQLEKDKGIWVSRKNPNLTCATLGLVEASHDLCMELMDVFLSAEIGHGSLCKDETCKLCKPEKMSLKKKREPKYFLELFGGTAVLTSAVKGKRLNALYPFEVGNSCIFDLRRRSTQRIVIDLVCSGKIWFVHLPFNYIYRYI